MKTTAGQSALDHFRHARRRWRRRVMGRVVPPMVFVLVLLLALESMWGTSGLDWFLGILFGTIVGVLLWLWDAPPAHIENWRRGATGERRTATVLRALERDGWRVAHDLPGRNGNHDHVVVGPAGAFLLDSKAYEGVVAVDGDSLSVERPDNPRAAYELRRLAPSLRAAAAALKAELQAHGGERVWVQVVVVIWSAFPQRVAAGDRVVFVHGDELVRWLRSRPTMYGSDRVDTLARSVDALRAGPAVHRGG